MTMKNKTPEDFPQVSEGTNQGINWEILQMSVLSDPDYVLLNYYMFGFVPSETATKEQLILLTPLQIYTYVYVYVYI